MFRVTEKQIEVAKNHIENLKSMSSHTFKIYEDTIAFYRCFDNENLYMIYDYYKIVGGIFNRENDIIQIDRQGEKCSLTHEKYNSFLSPDCREFCGKLMKLDIKI
jgi:hypothetical protein